ncbi:MAG: hypothetical protein Q8L27_01680 [archaeon]|nr:hypothetical protein [archaeon]
MSKFTDRVKQGINVSNTYKELPVSWLPGTTKNKRSKMIQNVVNQKQSKLPPEKRSISNVIVEKEKMDKELKAKMKSKGVY